MFIILMTVGIAINVQGIYNRYALEWNGYPNIDEYPITVFDWRFPQFLMTEEALAKKYSIQGAELGIFVGQSERISSNINIINKAVKDYLKTTKDFNDLCPVTLEELGLLDKSFGGHPRNTPEGNWTNNGYWIGAGKDAYGIGYAPVVTDVVKCLYNTYSKEAEVIYFPHPKIFSPKTASRFEMGQILIVFKRPRP
jgi:hypothetical protein